MLLHSVMFFILTISYESRSCRANPLACLSQVLHIQAPSVDWEVLLCRCIFNKEKNSFTLISLHVVIILFSRRKTNFPFIEVLQ
jgi:hypothetical protein